MSTSRSKTTSWSPPAEPSGDGRRGRIEPIVRRALRRVAGAKWVLGVFNLDGDLLEYVISGRDLPSRTALRALCAVPLPVRLGSITQKIVEHDEALGTAFGVATTLGPDHAVVLVVMPSPAYAGGWQGLSYCVKDALLRIASVIAASPETSTEERKAMLSFRKANTSFFILNPDLEICAQWYPRDPKAIDFAELVTPHGNRLPALLERSVRRLTADWDFAHIETCSAGTANPVPGLAMRVAPIRGESVLIGVSFEQYAVRQSIDHSTKMFRISARERDVLYALLDGHSIAQIATELGLAESTVNDHIARLIEKTNTRNRIHMAATLLGWPALQAKLAATQQAATAKTVEPEAAGAQNGITGSRNGVPVPGPNGARSGAENT